MKHLGAASAGLLLVLMLTAALAGCGKSVSSAGAEAPDMHIDFENGQPIRTGTEQQFYRVEQGQSGELQISVHTESGSLQITVAPTDAPDRFCYRGMDLPTSDFSVILSEPGEYQVWIEADHFMGNYAFQWTVS